MTGDGVFEVEGRSGREERVGLLRGSDRFGKLYYAIPVAFEVLGEANLDVTRGKMGKKRLRKSCKIATSFRYSRPATRTAHSTATSPDPRRLRRLRKRLFAHSILFRLLIQLLRKGTSTISYTYPEACEVSPDLPKTPDSHS